MSGGLVFLVGFMGCGKTTLGSALGALPGWRFLDMDLEIERREGMPVARIFAERGAAAFRGMERALLAEICARGCLGQRLVVATGGGTPLDPANMEMMNRAGLTVWLRASRPRLLERLAAAQDQRPLLRGLGHAELEAKIDGLERERRAFYQKARAEFCSDSLEDADQIKQSAEAFRQQFLT